MTTGEISVMQPKTLDDLLKQVTAALERDVRVNAHQWPITTRIQNEQLVLAGKVENIAAKKVARTLAQQIAGAWPVDDQLRVTPAEPKEDKALRDAVLNNLLQEPSLRECSLRVQAYEGLELIRDVQNDAGGVIELDIHGGVITLSGHVVSLTHRRLTEVLAWWTSGCEAVINRLEVVPPENDNDGELADAVRIVLEKDPLVHASELVAHVQDGVVTLQGYVANAEEKKFAALDAWYTLGVRDVVDRIEVRS